MRDAMHPDSGPLDEDDQGADRRFVDALLLHHYQGSRASSVERVEIVLRQLGHATQADSHVSPPSRAYRNLRRLVAAAAVIVALLLVPNLISNTASAQVARAAIAMSRAVDLHYRIEITTPMGQQVPGDIWVRGAELVVLRLDTPAGELWAGEGRDVAWAVLPSPTMPVLVNEKGRLLEALKIQSGLNAPFFRIQRLLYSLGDGYDVEFGADGETIEARSISDVSGDLPLEVRVRLAPNGVVLELEAEWAPLFGPRGCKLTWVDDAELPASFYEHAAHHTGEREVLDQR